MNEKLSRRRFIQQSAAATGCGLLAGIFPLDVVAKESKLQQGMPNDKGEFILKNVRLETGFIRDDFEVTGTLSELFSLTIKDGKISAINPDTDAPGAIDARGYLLMPAMQDMHIHLDKTYFGGPWKARSKRQRSVQDMIELEKQILPDMLKTSTEHAEKLIELLQSKGTCFARSHVNIEPTSQLQSLQNLQKAIENKKNTFGTELVAFPQHGLFCSGSEGLMKDAAQMDIDFIGGLDPYSIDGSIDKPIDFTVQLALDYNKGIDIHLHEGMDSGYPTILYLIDKVNENPSLKGKTYLSHCFALRQLEPKVLEDTAVKLANAGIGITTTVPMGSMPIPTLLKHGVQVMTGTDCVMDHWQSFGSGSMLQKAQIVAQLYGYNGDLELSRCLRVATGGVLALDDEGKQQWPKVGDVASFNLIDASCSAEAVARQSRIKALYYKGKCAYQDPLYSQSGVV